MRPGRPFCLKCQVFTELDDAGDPAHPCCAYCGHRRIEWREEILDPPAPNISKAPRLEVSPPEARPATPLRKLTDADASRVLELLICDWNAVQSKPEIARAVLCPHEHFKDVFTCTVIEELVLNSGVWAAARAQLPARLLADHAERVAVLDAVAGQPTS